MPAPPLATTDHPLVSCLMPTSAARRAYIPHAVRWFLRQDWPAKELVVIDDGAEPVRDLLPDLPSIRYVRLEQKMPLGAKRNRGCEAAQGDILVHWDDDDWMSARRLTLQAEALLAGKADLCGLDRLLYFEPSSGKAWEYVYPGRGRPWVAGGTFCYRREVWRRNRFPAIDVGEDTRFLWAGRGPRILALPDNRFYVGLIHAGNTSTKHTADPRWQPRPAELLHGVLGADLTFYGLAPAAPSRDSMPLVSCIMPTRDRPGFVGQSIEYFLRQDYPNRELVVIDDGAEPVERLLPADPRVRYLRCDGPLSLGEKRNRAIAASRGTIIAHWDDDDWYRRDYLSAVVATLLAGKDPRGLAGLGDYLVLLPGSAGHLKVCRSRGVAGATFCYFRGLWEGTRFRDVASAEDYFFLADAAPRLLPLKKPEMFMVVRHRGNTWQRDNGVEVERRLRRLPSAPYTLEQATGPADALFYRSLDAPPPQQPAARVVIDRDVPLVSCIMPTHNRRLFVPQAIRYFQRQDYPNKELVVVDDGTDPVGDLMPADERVRYIRLERKATIGEKRNRAVEASRGAIIVHFDDDDWHGAGRLTAQVEPLLRNEAEVCGLDTGWILNILDGQFWSCAGLHARMFYADVHGGSIGYKRDVWQRKARFPEINLAEDAAFLRRLRGRARIRKVLNTGIFVYIRHDENAWTFLCGQHVDPSAWKQVEPPPFMAPDLDFYTGFLREREDGALLQHGMRA